MVEQLTRHVPPSWAADVSYDHPGTRGLRADALAMLTGPDEATASVVIEVKRILNSRDIAGMVDQLRTLRGQFGPDATPLAAARYLSPSARSSLMELGVGYADATGNMHLALDRPALLIHTAGQDRDPWRGPGRPRGSLKGEPAARVVRALTDFTPPYTVPQLVSLSGVSTGAAYRVVDFLDQEGLLQRRTRGPITQVAWRRLIERWSRDHGLHSHASVVPCLLPRGVETLAERLRVSTVPYVVSGSIAAHHFAPYAPARLGMLYVTNFDDAVSQLDLRRVDRGANVLVVETGSDVAYERSMLIDGLSVAAPAQIALDLLTGPGRSPAEAEALLDWMEIHEPAWRRQPAGPSAHGAAGRP